MPGEAGHFDISEVAAPEQPSLMQLYGQTEVTLFGHTGAIEDLGNLCPIPPEERSREAVERFTSKLLLAAEVEIAEEHQHLVPEDLRPESWSLRTELRQNDLLESTQDDQQKQAATITPDKSKQTTNTRDTTSNEARETRRDINHTVATPERSAETASTTATSVEVRPAGDENKFDALVSSAEHDNEKPDTADPAVEALLAATLATAKLEFSKAEPAQSSAAMSRVEAPVPGAIADTVRADIIRNTLRETQETSTADVTNDATPLTTVVPKGNYVAQADSLPQANETTTGLQADQIRILLEDTELVKLDTLAEVTSYNESLTSKVMIGDTELPTTVSTETVVVDEIHRPDDEALLSTEALPTIEFDTAEWNDEQTYEQFVEALHALHIDPSEEGSQALSLTETEANDSFAQVEVIENPYLDLDSEQTAFTAEDTAEVATPEQPLVVIAELLQTADAKARIASMPLVIELTVAIRQLQAVHELASDSEVDDFGADDFEVRLENTGHHETPNLSLISAADAAEAIEALAAVEISEIASDTSAMEAEATETAQARLEAAVVALCDKLGIDLEPAEMRQLVSQLSGVKMEMAPASGTTFQTFKQHDETYERKTDATFIISDDDSGADNSSRIHSALGTMILTAFQQRHSSAVAA